jgi:hypothetical protein
MSSTKLCVLRLNLYLICVVASFPSTLLQQANTQISKSRNFDYESPFMKITPIVTIALGL